MLPGSIIFIFSSLEALPHKRMAVAELQQSNAHCVYVAWPDATSQNGCRTVCQIKNNGKHKEAMKKVTHPR